MCDAFPVTINCIYAYYIQGFIFFFGGGGHEGKKRLVRSVLRFEDNIKKKSEITGMGGCGPNSFVSKQFEIVNRTSYSLTREEIFE